MHASPCLTEDVLIFFFRRKINISIARSLLFSINKKYNQNVCCRSRRRRQREFSFWLDAFFVRLLFVVCLPEGVALVIGRIN